MNKRNAIYIAVIVAVALIGYIIAGNNKQEPQSNTNTTQTGTSTVGTTETTMSQTGGNVLPTTTGSYEIVAAESKLTWQGKKTLIPSWVDKGTINTKSGSATIEAGKLTGGEIVIDMSSISAAETGRGNESTTQAMLSNHLKSPDFFDVEKFPESKFTVKEATTTDGKAYTVKGDLTIKGKTMPIEFPATLTASGEDKVVFTANVPVDRSQFDVRFGSGKFFQDLGDKAIDDTFNLEFVVVGKKK